MERPESITELIKKYLTDEEQFRWKTDSEKMVREARKRQGEDKSWKKAIQRTRECDKKKKKSKRNKRNRPKNEWFPMPNKFVEAIYKQYLRPNESKVLWFLIRKIWGWDHEREFIPLKQFANRLDMSKGRVCEALSALKKRRIVTQLGNKTYTIQEDTTLWRNRPKKSSKNK